MSGLDVLFLVVVLLPLFAAQWRVSLVGLAAQGALLWVAAGGTEVRADAGWVLDAADFLLLRAVLAPVLLHAAFRHRGVPARNDVIPANLIAWMVVIGLVLASFGFVGALEPTSEDGRLGVACASLLIGLFVLATQRSVFSQIIGVLRIENAVSLFALAGPGHAEPLVHGLHVLVTGGAIVLFVSYLQALSAPEGEPVEP